MRRRTSRSDWYETLLCLLEDEHKANVWLFFDDNQRIYRIGVLAAGGLPADSS